MNQIRSEILHNILIFNSQLKDVSDFRYPELTQKSKVIYEVIRIINNVPLFLEDHLKRLYNSAELENSKILIKEFEIINSINQLVRENRIENGNIKIEIHFTSKIQSLFLIYFVKHYYPTEYQYENGVNVMIYQTERKNPNSKTLNLNYKRNLDTIVNDNLVYEVLLVTKDGFITEGSKSNVFFIKGQKLFTAPIDLVLPGITRKYIFDIAHNKLLIDIVEKCVNIKNISEFDSAFITGTSPKVLPINKINGKNFDVNNKVLREIMNNYNKLIDNYIFTKS